MSFLSGICLTFIKTRCESYHMFQIAFSMEAFSSFLATEGIIGKMANSSFNMRVELDFYELFVHRLGSLSNVFRI